MRSLFVIVAAAFLVACSPSQSIKPEPSAEAPQGQEADCGAVGYGEVAEGLSYPQADYEVVASACVARSTWGWIDVSGLLAASSEIDVHVVAAVDGDPVGPEVQAPLGPALATPVGGAAFVGPGKHSVELLVATGAPDASVVVHARSWIRGEARQEWPAP